MQQAYRVLRVVAEAQTIRIVLALAPGELMLKELCTACAGLNTENSSGVKAVVLDFKTISETPNIPNAPNTHNTHSRSAENESVSTEDIDKACAAVRALEPPALAVVRSTVSAVASKLIQAADLTLVAQHAALFVRELGDSHHDTLTGEQALRLGYTTWSAPANTIDSEMERILAMLREKSAAALRLTKASTRLGSAQSTNTLQDAATRLQALKQVNEFYLAQVMQTTDAAEGLRAFLEKRKPRWKNR
jgi:enoyl-CoA hydratase/carnithine racemase